MNINYKKEFEPKLVDGKKIHTIRSYNPMIGEVINHIVYPYSSKRHAALVSRCTAVQSITVIPELRTVYVDGRQLINTEIEELAKNDGFATVYDFWEWFTSDFNGYIIHWTNKKY